MREVQRGANTICDRESRVNLNNTLLETKHTRVGDVIAVIVYLVRPNVTWLARIWKMTEYLFNQLYPFGSCWENFRKIENAPLQYEKTHYALF